MKKAIRAKEESNVKSAAPAEPSSEPLPQYLLDRSNPSNAKALSSAIKNKRKGASRLQYTCFKNAALTTQNRGECPFLRTSAKGPRN